jgi:flagellar biogenesis protein FliO
VYASRWVHILATLLALAFGISARASSDSKSEFASGAKGPFEQESIRRPGGGGNAGNGGNGGATPGSTRSQAGGASSSWDIGRVLLGLGAVILLFLAMVGLGKKVAPGAMGPKPNAAIRVLTKSSVSPRQQLMLVQVGRRVVLVGSGGGEMRPLCEIADPDEVAELVAQINDDKASSPRSFMTLFGKAEAKYVDAEPPASEEDLGGVTEHVRGIGRQFQK